MAHNSPDVKNKISVPHQLLQMIGVGVLSVLESLGSFIKLMMDVAKSLFSEGIRIQATLQQLVFVTYESLPIVVFCVSSAAAVTIVESSFHMKLVVKNDELVPGFAALLILRELGVVVSALLVTSRVGAGIAAEVGSMKVTEQLDALKMLSMNPIRYIVVPRFVACVVGGVLLSFIANVICVYVAMLVSNYKLGYSVGSFLVGMRSFVEMKDLWFAAIKGGVFGGIIPLVSCYFGFKCRAGSEGVGLATTQSVVAASVLIIGFDFLLSYIFTFFY